MDKETQELLEALGRKELNLDFSEEDIRELKQAMREISSTARLAHTIADRPRRTDLYEALADELDALSESPAFDVMERAGLTDLLDENFGVIVTQLSPNDIPPEDHDFLRTCGMTTPKDEVTITITRLRMGAWPSTDGGRRRAPAAELMQVSRHAVRASASELRQGGEVVMPSQSSQNHLSSLPKKPKKYFNGIGKILSGVVAGTGNVLIGAGAIPATAGTAAAAVFASGALSLGLVMQGIGDLRGE